MTTFEDLIFCNFAWYSGYAGGQVRCQQAPGHSRERHEHYHEGGGVAWVALGAESQADQGVWL